MDALIVIVVVVGALAALLYPLWRPPLLAFDEGAGPASQLAQLEDRKHALYGAIRDAGFDLRTDKMTDADYAREVASLKTQAVAVLAQIEALRGQVPRASDELEAEIAALRTGDPIGQTAGAAAFCTQCGHPLDDADRFCGGCGRPLEAKP